MENQIIVVVKKEEEPPKVLPKQSKYLENGLFAAISTILVALIAGLYSHCEKSNTIELEKQRLNQEVMKELLKTHPLEISQVQAIDYLSLASNSRQVIKYSDMALQRNTDMKNYIFIKEMLRTNNNIQTHLKSRQDESSEECLLVLFIEYNWLDSKRPFCPGLNEDFIESTIANYILHMEYILHAYKEVGSQREIDIRDLESSLLHKIRNISLIRPQEGRSFDFPVGELDRIGLTDIERDLLDYRIDLLNVALGMIYNSRNTDMPRPGKRNIDSLVACEDVFIESELPVIYDYRLKLIKHKEVGSKINQDIRSSIKTNEILINAITPFKEALDSCENPDLTNLNNKTTNKCVKGLEYVKSYLRKNQSYRNYKVEFEAEEVRNYFDFLYLVYNLKQEYSKGCAKLSDETSDKDFVSMQKQTSHQMQMKGN